MLRLGESHCVVAALGTVLALLSCSAPVAAQKDTTHAECESWCGNNEEHKKWCKCRACSFVPNAMKQGDKCSAADLAVTACEAKDENDLPYESCSSWCSSKYAEAHCGMCACKACSYCVEALQARVPCSSFAPKGDVDYERCDSFCDSRFSEVHCSLCRCRGCSYCEDIPICDPIIRDDCACEPTTDKDSRTMQCASWCTKDTHCKQCKCAGCPLCASRTSIPRAPPQLRPPLILATQAASSNEHPAAALLRPPVPPEPSPWPPEEAWSPTPSPPPGSNGGLSIASAPPSGAIRSEYGGHAAGEAFVQGNVLPGSGDFPPHTSQQLDASPTDTLFAEVSTIVAIVVLGATLLAIAGCAIRASASFLGVWSEHDLPRSRRAGRRQAERSGTMSIRAEETMTRSAEQPLQIPVNLLVEGTSLLLGGLEKQLLKGMNVMRLRALVLKMVIEHEDEFLKDDPVSMHDLQLEVRNRFGQTIALTSQSTLPSGIRAINARVR